jgi:hypothetical protein
MRSRPKSRSTRVGAGVDRLPAADPEPRAPPGRARRAVRPATIRSRAGRSHRSIASRVLLERVDRHLPNGRTVAGGGAVESLARARGQRPMLGAVAESGSGPELETTVDAFATLPAAGRRALLENTPGRVPLLLRSRAGPARRSLRAGRCGTSDGDVGRTRYEIDH